MIKVTILGTSGMLPLKDRFMVSNYIEHEGHAILVDCGEATQIAMRRFGVKMNKIDAIFFTHDHGDHTLGLPGLLLSMSSGGRTVPVDLFYPQAAEEALQGLLRSCDFLGFELRFTPLPNDRAAEFAYPTVDENLTVSSMVLQHSTVCLGYRFRFDKKPAFQPTKAKALNIPVSFYKTLHSGRAVTLPDGRVIVPEQVLGSPKEPTIIVNITDSVPLPAMAEFASHANLLICEGMYGDEGMKPAMDEKGHMLMQDACRIAKAAHVKHLLLTHYSPANPEPWEYEAELRQIFPDVVVSRDGECIELN